MFQGIVAWLSSKRLHLSTASVNKPHGATSQKLEEAEDSAFSRVENERVDFLQILRLSLSFSTVVVGFMSQAYRKIKKKTLKAMARLLMFALCYAFESLSPLPPSVR